MVGALCGGRSAWYPGVIMDKADCKTCRVGIADNALGKFQYVFQEESQDFCSEECRSRFIEDPEKYTAREDAEEEE